MLRLKFLFNNPDLAEMLLKNWEYDRESLDLFRDFRISANAVYPFRREGVLCFLRFCPVTEKRKENILAELAFISYLRGRQYPALEPILCKSGKELIQQTTPWGEYFACVFKGVDGVPVDDTNLKEEVVFAYGASLGQLHQLSSEYQPKVTVPRTHHTLLDWMEETLRDLGEQGPALSEIDMLRKYFSGLSAENGCYGLIHYDFELDNVFYDENRRACNVIDFDDVMLHWYGMDIVQALDSLERETDVDDFPQKKVAFLSGYRSRYMINDDWMAAILAFRRYGNLLRYTRIARALHEEWENEPDWMVMLRKKLHPRLQKYAAVFGKEIA